MLKISKGTELHGKQVKVGFSTIDIKEQAPQFKKDNMTDCYGQYTHRENQIEIQPGLSNIDEANTLLHEILHVCVYISSLSQDGQPLASDNDEEVIYELEKYSEPKPKVLTTVWVVDEEHPNLKTSIRKKI